MAKDTAWWSGGSSGGADGSSGCCSRGGGNGGNLSECTRKNLIVSVYYDSTYRCNGRVQLTDVHAAGRVLTVVRVVSDPPVFTWLHGRLGCVRV